MLFASRHAFATCTQHPTTLHACSPCQPRSTTVPAVPPCPVLQWRSQMPRCAPPAAAPSPPGTAPQHQSQRGAPVKVIEHQIQTRQQRTWMSGSDVGVTELNPMIHPMLKHPQTFTQHPHQPTNNQPAHTWPVTGSCICCLWFVRAARRPPNPKLTLTGRLSQFGGRFSGRAFSPVYQEVGVQMWGFCHEGLA